MGDDIGMESGRELPREQAEFCCSMGWAHNL